MTMTKSTKVGMPHQATTPRAAAVAGILFAALFGISIVLVRLSLPADMTEVTWTETARGCISLALRLIPFAGIAFLWFVGVVRDRLGDFEDKFFSTVTLGSGLLFLATSFIAFAISGGMFLTDQVAGGQGMTLNVYLLNRLIISQIFNTYALKMAGVFMFSLSTLWQKTGVMPRWLSLLTYILVAVMFVSLSLSLWMALIFPAWVLIISIYILVLNYRHRSGGVDGLPAQTSG
jgi:hypothetical protein